MRQTYKGASPAFPRRSSPNRFGCGRMRRTSSDPPRPRPAPPRPVHHADDARLPHPPGREPQVIAGIRQYLGDWPGVGRILAGMALQQYDLLELVATMRRLCADEWVAVRRLVLPYFREVLKAALVE